MILSIIIPSMQQGNFLTEALQSIQIQEFDNYEIIIMDNNSTDNTIDVVKGFNSLPIRFINSSDNGVYDAMNKAIKIAYGEWIYFMGCDDKLFDKSLAKLLNLFTDNSLDIIYGNVLFSSNLEIKYDGKFDIDKLLKSKNICHQSIFYKKSVFESIGFYNLRYKIWSDWEFNIRCFRHTEFKIKYIDVVVAIYNDLSGISKQEDPIFRKELPVFYMQEIDRIVSEKNKKNYFKSFLYFILSKK